MQPSSVPTETLPDSEADFPPFLLFPIQKLRSSVLRDKYAGLVGSKAALHKRLQHTLGFHAILLFDR